jgi:large conductance mechanosensitive channel
MIQEFRKFILRGNVIDLAVGIIIGAAFTAIVASLVADVIMPVISIVTGRIDFKNLYIPLSEAAAQVSPPDIEAARKAGGVIAYGSFITAVINFLIIAIVVFLLVRMMNNIMERFKRQEEAKVAEAPAPTVDQLLLTEIRDLLRKQTGS